jgi:hypothetical protein
LFICLLLSIITNFAGTALFPVAFTGRAKFSGDTPADPMKIHRMFVSALGANALHFHLIKVDPIIKLVRLFDFNCFPGPTIAFLVQLIYAHLERISSFLSLIHF